MGFVRSLALILTLASVSFGFGQVTLPQPKKSWTVLVYQAGDNDLEEALIKDFNEMERIGSGATINIVVQIDRSPRYDYSNDNWTTTRRYYVTRDSEESFPPDFSTRPNHTIRSYLIADLGKKNMGDPNVLRDFLIWGIQNFPADRYFVILSDHGAGVRPFRGLTLLPFRGMMFTDTLNDYLSEDETKQAFASAIQFLGRPFDIVGLDASEMSEIEIAYQLRDACKYLIASQLSEPNDGYPYDRFLWELHKNPSISTEEFLRQFVQHYIDSYRPGQPTNGAGSAVTIAVYNQSVVPFYVQRVNSLAQTLLRKIDRFGTKFLSLRRQTQTFSETIYRDLYHYCQLLVQNINDSEVRQAAQSVMDLHGPGANKALLYEAHASGYDLNVSNAYGIAIYFPEPNQFDERYLNANDFARTTKWGNFLQALQTDSFPPKVLLVFPAENQSLPVARPAILLKVEDEGAAGLDSNAVTRVFLNGVALTNFEFDETTGRLKIVPTQPLSDGDHSLSVTVVDKAENRATYTFSFSVNLPRVSAGVRAFSIPLWLSSAGQRQTWQSFPEKVARWIGTWAVFNRDGTGNQQASFYPINSGVATPPAGLGYFARFDREVKLDGDGEPLEPDYPYSVTLQDGWNLIANPFPAPILWDSARVQVGNQTYPLATAIINGFILSPLIGYLPNSTEPFKFGSYYVLTGTQVLMQPFEAYWVRVDTQGKTVKLILPPPISTDSSSKLSAFEKLWSVRLQVLTGERSLAAGSELLEFGVARNSKIGQDIGDVPMPPMPAGASVRAFFVTENWRKRTPEILAVDMKPSSEKVTWDLIVESDDPKEKELTLTWNDLHKVPSSVMLWLVDLETGQIVSLRSASAYRFGMNNHQRRFRIIAETSRSPLRLVGVRAFPTRGGKGAIIQGSLTAPANLTVTVRSLTGRVLKVLAKERPMSSGRWQILWDGRSQDGLSLPAGTYICEVVAKDETGRQVRSVVPLTIGL
ncbi:MAG: clostripain-related cysteine peptidase [Armatimonadetes bacterium]|nr:clostripain-related cysteine peptidase [Armatimonadota bacterium]